MDGKDFRKITVVIEALRRHKEFQTLIESKEPFLIYHTETGRVLARGIYGYSNAKDASNQVRKRLGLKWDQVSFKLERNFRPNLYKTPQRGRIDYAPRFNPSKNTRFRVRINPDGSTGDID